MHCSCEELGRIEGVSSRQLRLSVPVPSSAHLQPCCIEEEGLTLGALCPREGLIYSEEVQLVSFYAVVKRREELLS